MMSTNKVNQLIDQVAPCPVHMNDEQLMMGRCVVAWPLCSVMSTCYVCLCYKCIPAL